MRHRKAFLVAVLAIVSTPAFASFHFARISEIFPGSAEYPNAQYIVIVPFSNSQNLFAGVRVTVFDAAGVAQPDFAVFAANLPSTVTNQSSILVATLAAQTLFGITPNQSATGSLPPSGLICFRSPLLIPDCVSYGNYTGNTLVGGSPAGPPATAPPNGMALRRDFGANGTLEALDDTNNSSVDFFSQVPAPKNFAGVTVSNLTVSKLGGSITLTWSGSGATTSLIHKTDDASTVRLSAQIAMVPGPSWTDPNPNQFPGLSCYVVKP